MKSDDPWFYDHFQLMIEHDCLELHIINDRLTYDRVTYDRLTYDRIIYDRAINNEQKMNFENRKRFLLKKKKESSRNIGDISTRCHGKVQVLTQFI